MRKIILAGISISLLAGMIFTACENAQTDLKRESSVSVSSVYMNSETFSADIASVLSESASSTVTSSNKAVSSNKITSSNNVSSSTNSTSSDRVTSSYKTIDEMPPVVLEGEAIPFTAKMVKQEMGRHIDLDQLLINSYNELISLGKIDTELQTLLKEKYNEEFFKEKSLILKVFNDGSSGFSHRIDAVARKNQVLYLGATTHRPQTSAAVLCWSAFTIEVQRKDIASVSEIKLIQNSNNEIGFNYPLTKRESIPNGTSLKITASKMLRVNQQPAYYQKGNFTMVVMKNEKDLTTFKNTINDDVHNYDRYNKDFFENNTLMAVFIPYLSGSIKAQVKSLIQTEDEICIIVTVLTPANHILTDDVNYQFMLIETSKDNLSGVKNFGYYKETQTY